jgi:hypothetical protein
MKYQVKFGWFVNEDEVKFDNSFIKTFNTLEEADNYVDVIMDIMVETRDNLWESGISEEEILQLCKCYDSWEIEEI